MIRAFFNVIVYLFFFLCIHSSVLSQLDTLRHKEAFDLLDEAKKCYSNSPNSLQCPGLLKKSYESSGHHPYFLEQIVSLLITNKKYDEARNYVYISRIDTLPNSLKARHHHFKGLLELKSGFNYFTPAYQSFQKAYYCELRSRYPTFKFLSQIQNAMGYTRLLYGGPNKNNPDDYPHANWVTSDILSALKHFEQALYFDKDNPNAQINKDTLFNKILQSGKDAEEIVNLIKAKPISVLQSELKIFEKSENDTLDKINFSLLPNNKEVLLRTLERYEELLLVADISGSMDDIHSMKGVSRFRLMKELILFLFHRLSSGTKIGIVTVGRRCKDPPVLFFQTDVNARKDIMDRFKELRPFGSTPLSYSISRGKQLFSKKETSKAVFLISDGMETCGDPIDLCVIAGDLFASGIDLHIISFIVEGMEDSELAYEIYHCMTQYSQGKVFKYGEIELEDNTREAATFHEEILLLPPIKLGDNLKGILHFEVDLSEYFSTPVRESKTSKENH